MAVTRVWPIKGQLHHSLDYVNNPEKTENSVRSFEEQSLLNVMHYATNDNKTEKRFFVSGINCQPEYARDQFVTVKKQFDKEGGIVAYHAYQSFMPGEVTPAKAHELGKELARTLWGDNFQVIVATHLNTDCYHNHLVVNSISFKDGHRCRQAKWYELQAVSDEICLRHGLSIVQKNVNKAQPHYEASSEKAGMPTRHNLAKAAIDEAISKSCNLQEFNAHLKGLGYTTQFNPKRKYWTITLPGWSKPIRLARLGEAYTNEKILERIATNSPLIRIKSFQDNRQRKPTHRFHTKRPRRKVYGSLYKLYLHYCYQLGIIPKRKTNPNRLHYLLRDDLIKVDQLSTEFKFLSRHKIETIGALGIYKANTKQNLDVLIIGRNVLRKKSRRRIPETEKNNIRQQIATISNQIKNLRKEVKLCERIENRALKMHENLQAIKKEDRRKEYYKS